MIKRAVLNKLVLCFSVILFSTLSLNIQSANSWTKKIENESDCTAAKATWLTSGQTAISYTESGGQTTIIGPGCYETTQVQTSLGSQKNYKKITEYGDGGSAVNTTKKNQANSLTTAKTKDEAVAVLKTINGGKSITNDQLTNICGYVDILNTDVSKIIKDSGKIVSQDTASALCIQHGKLTEMIGEESTSSTPSSGLVDQTESEKDADAQAQAEYEASIEDEETTSGSSCAIDGLGWIICPVVNLLANTVDSAYDAVISPFLEVNSQKLMDNSAFNSGWSSIRDVVNILLVISIIIVILSQITGFGISNYGIKKMLPKMIVAAILINISFYVCLLALDISNILGNGLYQLTSGLSENIDSVALTAVQTGNNLVSTAASITATAALVYILLAPLLLVLLSGLISIVVGMLCLVVRQAGIIVLIIFSPLAFLAMIFPNTEGFYKKWQKSFLSLLMIYPMIGVVMGVSGFVGAIISDIGVTQNTPGVGDTLLQLAGSLIMLLPAIAIPTLSKKSLEGLGSLGGAIQGKLNGLGGKIDNKMTGENSAAGKFAAHRKMKSMENSINAKTGNYKGRNIFRRGQQYIRTGSLGTNGNGGLNAFADSKAGEYLGMNKSLAKSINIADKFGQEQIDLTAGKMSRSIGNDLNKGNENLEKAFDTGSASDRKAAIDIMMSSFGAGKTAEAIQKLTNKGVIKSGDQDTQAAMAYASGKHFKDLKSKNIAVANYMSNLGTGGTKSLSDIYDDAGTWLGANNNELSQQDASALAGMAKSIGGMNLEDRASLSNKANSIINDPKLRSNLNDSGVSALNQIGSNSAVKQNEDAILYEAERNLLNNAGVNQSALDTHDQNWNKKIKKEIEKNITDQYAAKDKVLKDSGVGKNDPARINIAHDAANEINKYK